MADVLVCPSCKSVVHRPPVGEPRCSACGNTRGLKAGGGPREAPRTPRDAPHAAPATHAADRTRPQAAPPQPEASAGTPPDGGAPPEDPRDARGDAASSPAGDEPPPKDEDDLAVARTRTGVFLIAAGFTVTLVSMYIDSGAAMLVGLIGGFLALFGAYSVWKHARVFSQQHRRLATVALVFAGIAVVLSRILDSGPATDPTGQVTVEGLRQYLYLAVVNDTAFTLVPLFALFALTTAGERGLLGLAVAATVGTGLFWIATLDGLADGSVPLAAWESALHVAAIGGNAPVVAAAFLLARRMGTGQPAASTPSPG